MEPFDSFDEFGTEANVKIKEAKEKVEEIKVRIASKEELKARVKAASEKDKVRKAAGRPKKKEEPVDMEIEEQ